MAVVIAAMFVASGVIVYPLGQRAYNRWALNRFTRLAWESFEKGDLKQARDHAQSAMGRNPYAPEAVRVMAKSLEGSNPKEAIQWRRHLERMRPGDPENTLAIAKDLVKKGDVDSGDRALRILQSSERNSAFYHDVAALIALGKRDVEGAARHWEEAMRIEPLEDDYRLSLAALRIKHGGSTEREAAMAVLKILVEKPAQRLGSLRAMIEYATKRRDEAQSKELVNTLANDPKATFDDKLLRLATLRAMNDSDSTKLLLELRDASIANPEELFQLLSWMNQNNLALMVSDWTSTLPEYIISAAPVGVAIAEACARGSEWKKLRLLLERGQWGRIEAVRLIFLSRALLKLNESEASDVAWKSALVAAQGNADLLESIARSCMDWEWKERAEESMWKLSTNPRCPRWILDSLRSWSSQRADAGQLHRVNSLLEKKDPANVAARKDAIFYGLLVRSKEEGLHARAEAFYRENPGDETAAVIFGLSLYERARPTEAADVMKKLKPAQLREPGIARYYGLFLVAAGQSGMAKEYVELGAGGSLFREEGALLALAKMGFSEESANHLRRLNEAAHLDPDDFSKLIVSMSEHEVAPLVSAWSASIDRAIVQKPPAAIAFAQADVKANEWERLKDATEAARWGASEFLRNAYLARAFERLNDAEGAEDSWKVAVELATKVADSTKTADDLDTLAKTALGWGWQAKAEAVLWELSAFDSCPRWALETLWKAASQQGNSAQLYRVARLLSEMDPKSIAARNNAVSLSLLTRGQEMSAHEIAASLFKEAPSDADVVTTYALSLYLRGSADGALAAMRGLALGQLSEPRAAFYMGVFLTADRQVDEARPYLENGKKRSLLAEEKELLAMARLGPSAERDEQIRQLNGALSSPSPENLAMLIARLNANDFAPIVSGWSVGIAPELASKPPVCIAIAEAHSGASEWVRLKELTASSSWGQFEYQRHAFLSRALEHLGDSGGAAVAWKGSVDAAQKNSASLAALAKMILSWGWEQKAEDVLWRYAADPFCPRWALESLWKISVKRRPASELLKISRLLPGSDPKRDRSRNNAIVLALLTHSNDAAVREFAEALHQETPANLALAAIHAMSLSQKNRQAAAQEVMEPFKPEAFKELRSAFYYGIYLAVSGKEDLADEFFDIAVSARLVRDEEAAVALARAGTSNEEIACVQRLNETVSAKPEELAKLVTDLVGQDRAQLVSAWSVTLATEPSFRLPARIAIAEAHESAAAWSRLRESAESGSWGRFDFRRRAFLSRALEKTNDLKGSAREWKAAMDATQHGMDALDTLAKTALRWGWRDRAEEALWEMSGNTRCPRWAFDALRDAILNRGSATQLFEVNKRLAKAELDNLAVRNDVNFFGLLCRSDEAGLRESAEVLFKGSPTNVDFAKTYAFALYQRGMGKEAVECMGALNGDQLREPRNARYYGIFLCAAEQAEKAKAYLELGGKGPLLDAEKALLAMAKLAPSVDTVSVLKELNAAFKSKPEDLSKLVAKLGAKELAPVVSAWALGLERGFVAKPPVCTAIAEAHAKAGEWVRLKEMTESENWEQLDFLRRAFLSRALGRLDAVDGAADAWRSAISAAEKSPDKLETLAKSAMEWGWSDKAEEALWKLVARDGCPRWTYGLLMDYSRKRKIAGRSGVATKQHNAADSHLARTRQSAIIAALLARGTDADVRKLAEALYNENRKNPSVAAIEALSMTLDGRTNAALTMMGTFQVDELREPGAAFSHGIFLAVAKESALAREFLEIAATAKLSPDEKSLLLRMKGTLSEERKPTKPVEPVKTTLSAPRDGEPALR